MNLTGQAGHVRFLLSSQNCTEKMLRNFLNTIGGNSVPAPNTLATQFKWSCCQEDEQSAKNYTYELRNNSMLDIETTNFNVNKRMRNEDAFLVIGIWKLNHQLDI